MSDTGFLITAFDQIREVKFTVNMLRTMWERTKGAPIVIVISGDHERNLLFNDDPMTRVVHLDDMVGDDFNNLVSTSIAKQIEHGMIEMKDLERVCGQIKNIVHMHGDILLLNENGFFEELERFVKTDKVVAADSVGRHKNNYIRFWGEEIMPQLFVVNHAFCKATGFMYSMSIQGDLETRSTEWMLIGNLHRSVYEPGGGEALMPYSGLDMNAEEPPYVKTFDEHVYAVRRGRSQWDLHRHWGGFCHYGNQLHYSREIREKRNEQALKAYGVSLENW